MTLNRLSTACNKRATKWQKVSTGKREKCQISDDQSKSDVRTALECEYKPLVIIKNSNDDFVTRLSLSTCSAAILCGKILSTIFFVSLSIFFYYHVVDVRIAIDIDYHTRIATNDACRRMLGQCPINDVCLCICSH